MVKHLISYAFAKILPGIINFLTLIIFARIFNPSELGNYYYLMSILTLGSSTLFSWIRLSSFRYYNNYVESFNKSEYYSYVFSLNFILAITIFIIVSFPYFCFINNELYGLFIVGSISILVSIFFEQAISFLRSEFDSKSYAIFSILRPVFKLIIIIFLTQILLLKEVSIFLGIMFSDVILLGIYYYKIRKKNIKLYITVPWKNKSLTKDFITYGFPLTITILFSIVLSTSDRIFIEHFLDSESVAIYSMGYDITSFIITNIFMIINLSYYPIIIKLIDSNKIDVAREKLNDYFLLQNIIVIPVTLTLFFFAEEISNYILGKNYNNQDTLLTIKLISLSAFIAGIKAYYFDFAFQIGKNTKLQIVPVIVAAIINIILNFILIPIFGLIGAIFSTVIAYVVSILLSIILGKYAFELEWYTKDLIQIVIQIIVIIFVYYSIKIDINSWVDSLINLCFYVLLIGIFVIINLKKIKNILR